MEPARQVQKRYCSRAMMVAIAGGFICILFGYKPLGKGLVLGTCFSILNFILMGESISFRLNTTAKRAFVTALGSILVRFAMMAVPLVISIRSAAFSFPAVVGGLFMVQGAILFDHLTTLNRRIDLNNS